MALWLENELAGVQNLSVIVVAKTDDSGIGSEESVEPDELREWKAAKGLGNCDFCYFLDGDKATGGYEVWDKFVNANTQFRYTAGIPMLIRHDMTIREISGTYEWNEYPFDILQEIIAEVP